MRIFGSARAFGWTLVATWLALAAPLAAADGWIELRSTPAGADVPTYQGLGAYDYPYPVLNENGQFCPLNGNFVLCVPVFTPEIHTIRGPYPIITYQHTDVPFYTVYAWSPVTATVTCGPTTGYGRYVVVTTTIDPTGTHTYVPLKTVTQTLPSNFALASGFDYGCAKANGEGVPQQLLP